MSFDYSIYNCSLAYEGNPGSTFAITVDPFTFFCNDSRRADQSQTRNTAFTFLPHYFPPSPPNTRGTSEVDSIRVHVDERRVQGDGDIQPAVGALPPMLAPSRGEYDGCYWNAQVLYAAFGPISVIQVQACGQTTG